LVDAAGEYQPVGPTGRYRDFSGDLLDQVMLTAVMANLASTGAVGHPGVPRLARLRAECRTAKEQLSASTVTTLLDVEVTRAELHDAIGDSLTNFMAFFETTLRSNGIRESDVAAVVSVGGGASLPMVTTALSGRLRVPVVTTPRPQLAAAVGGALRAARSAPGAGVFTLRTAALAR
jgi:molecular chaperone DnaK (HSP70)